MRVRAIAPTSFEFDHEVVEVGDVGTVVADYVQDDLNCFIVFDKMPHARMAFREHEYERFEVLRGDVSREAS